MPNFKGRDRDNEADEDPWDRSDVDYYGYGEEQMLDDGPVSMEVWKADQAARTAELDSGRDLPGYDDPQFYERQAAVAKSRDPKDHCSIHLRALSTYESTALGGRCSWCNPQLHRSFAISLKAPGSDKKSVEAHRKAVQDQEALKTMGTAIEGARLAHAEYSDPVAVRYCATCPAPLKVGQQWCCTDCVAASYARIPERYRYVLEGTAAERASTHDA